ncbi:MAG: ABC transporter permease [Lachnospiraceae bacterium]|nr:ABC transporter permease [Lachnospiraceae bacterium]
MKPVGFNKKKLIVLFIACFFLVVFGIFKLLTVREISGLPYANVAKEWSPEGGYSHISAYFTPSAALDSETLKYLHRQIETKLNSESIENESENESARMIASTFFGNGKLYITSSTASVELNAIGVWGDFFLIHKQEMLTGGYFDASDLNDDYCIIDEEAAWKLFGSNDVAGQTVYVGDSPLIIRGVFKQPDDKISAAAGASGLCCYVSFEYLLNHGILNNISCYEIVMPNPVPGYAMTKLTDALSIEDTEVEYVENTGRFGVINAVKGVKDIKLHSMRTKALVFPWWENVTRVKGEKISVFSFIYVSGIIIAAGIVLVLAVILFIQNKDIIAYNFVLLYERIRDSFYKRRIQKERGDL